MKIPLFGGPKNATPAISRREKPTVYHPHLAIRLPTINVNMLALRGGREYIAIRLSRFPAESDIDFYGVSAKDAGSMPELQVCLGRRDRAFVPNYAGRIAEKLNQYVFQNPPNREGIDQDWAINCTATGETIGQFMSEASSIMTACRWCWASVGRPRGEPGESLAQRAMRGDRVFWRLWEPQEVINWEYDDAGRLLFVVTSEPISKQASPWAPRQDLTRITVWEPGKVTAWDGDTYSEAVTGIDFVPFRQIGTSSDKPWWFDDVEMCQKTLLDKQSALDTAIYKMVYPILVLPQGVIDNMMQENTPTDQISRMVRMKIGMSSPIVEGEGETGITRYVQGSTTDIRFIREEIRSSREELYETVGLALKTQSLAAQSGEAKAWDHLDAEAVLAQRAEVLENAETALVKMSEQIGVGGAFRAWAPKYSRTFDLTPLAEDIETVMKVGQMPLPSRAVMELVKIAYRKIAGEVGVASEVIDEMSALIDAFDPEQAILDKMAPREVYDGEGQPGGQSGDGPDGVEE
jgi:hypothetical protein